MLRWLEVWPMLPDKRSPFLTQYFVGGKSMHRYSWRITRISTTNIITASCHTIFPSSFDRSSIRHYYFHCMYWIFKNWRETCKPCDVIKSKWPREKLSPMIVCLCVGRGRKVKVRWKNLQSKHNH